MKISVVAASRLTHGDLTQPSAPRPGPPETNQHSHSPWTIHRGPLIAAGHHVVLNVVMVPVKLSASRAAADGHDVPADKITARYERIWSNVVAAVHRCRRTVAYDNSHDAGPVEVAGLRAGLPDYPPRWPNWTPEVLQTAFP